MAYKLIYNPLIDYTIRSHVAPLGDSIIYVVRLPVYVQWNGILWHASQIHMYMYLWWNQSIELLYNNAGYVISGNLPLPLPLPGHMANFAAEMICLHMFSIVMLKIT